MPKCFAAEVLIRDPADVPRVRAVLAAVGCSYVIDTDANGDPPTVFGMVVGSTELEQDDIGGWLLDIVWSVGGDCIEWSFGEPWKIRP
jgi:hypothetical protein